MSTVVIILIVLAIIGSLYFLHTTQNHPSDEPELPFEGPKPPLPDEDDFKDKQDRIDDKKDPREVN